MGTKRTPALVARLAHALASGSTAAAWARKNKLEVRTVGNWARLPECKALITSIRRDVTDRVVGKLTRSALSAVTIIHTLAEKGENESTRLSAARTIIDKLLDVSSHVASSEALAALQARIAELEKTLPANGK